VQKKIDAKQRALDGERDTRVRAAIESTLDTLRQQLAFAVEKESESRATFVRLENVEEQMRIITSMTLTSDDVDAFDLKVNEIWSCLKSELEVNDAMASLTTLQDLSADPVGLRLVAGEPAGEAEQPQRPGRQRQRQ
jgi:hypothetical protein